MTDHRKLKEAPHLVMSDLAQQQLPRIACGVMEQLFTVTNPEPKPGLRKIIRSQMKLNNLKLRDAVSQGVKALRTFG
jgi:electron transfer flavoprotein-quinone oxidoreductase